MKKNNQKIKMSYESEADVLRIEIGKRPIDYATEVGNMVVHFDKNGIPVYFEILEATGFLKHASTVLDPVHKKMLLPAFRS